MGRGTGAEAGGIQGLPLTTGTEHEQDGLHTDAVGGAWPTAAETMGVGVGGEQCGDTLPQVVGDVPVVSNGHIHTRSVFHGCTLLCAAAEK